MNAQVPQVFIDTNVWFSAFYGSRACEILIKAHIQGNITAVISQQVLSEIVKNLQLKIPRALPKFQQFVKASPPLMLADPKTIDKRIYGLINKKDQAIFSACLRSSIKIPYFITGNIKHFSREKLEKITDIKILTPTEAVKRFISTRQLHQRQLAWF
ncbi:DUF4935 domain-containing protein [Candidatus Gottesmanbacteria bacterium]|nr:DUF4935 domain-containing protein [Candidatus Gottesmanbacteria bacterium]